MGLHRVWRSASVLAAIVALAGCGSPATTATFSTAQTSSIVEAKAVPVASAFDTITATVTEILPADSHGLPHQNFIVSEISPRQGLKVEVNNDTKYGSEVKGLKVGMKLVIKGVRYHDDKRDKDGIHWTHKATKAGDAGYIQTPDGKKYE
ncbi:MAG TPA: DUF3465 domain-containing protein [Pantanalinema sp.]